MKSQVQRVSALTFVDPCRHDHTSDDQAFLDFVNDTSAGKSLTAHHILSQCDVIGPEFRGRYNYNAFRASWEEIYKQHTEEIDGIWRTCASDKSFDCLRSVERLRKSLIANQSWNDWDTIDVIAQVKATELAWKSVYEGDYSRTLVDTILQEQLGINNKLGNHTNYLVAIQSSGAGKSRTAYEAGGHMFSVSVNLRDAGGTGYPLRDAALCAFIARVAYRPLYRKKLHCAAFIHGIFSAALSVLECAEIKHNALAFRTCLDVERPIFDQAAATKADEAKQTNEAKFGYFEQSEAYQSMLQEYTIPAVLKFAEAAGISRDAQGKWKDLILFPIDEFHTLYPPKDDINDNTQSTYHALCSVLHDLIKTPIFALFMSTAFNTRQLAPPVFDDPSSRICNPGKLVQHPPYTAFPFDVYKAIIVENTRNLDEVCELSFLCRFGRPLWWTRWDSGDEDVRKGLIKFAMAKLKGGDLKVGNAAKFAALSTRHLLMFEPDRQPPGMDNKQYQAATVEEYRQVASHMRTVHCIPTHREYMHTSTPSEPILAEAAARLLALSECPQVKFLAEDLNPLVGKGERGELAARLLCNLAHDAALKTSPQIPDKNLEFSRPIRLIHFLEALIAPKSHSQLLDSRPVTGGNLPFRDAFDDCWVNFTHWSKIDDASCLTTAALWKAIARGTAWQCCDGMSGIDQVIPFVRGRDAKLGRGTVSAIAIQNQDRKFALKVKLDDEFPARLFADAPGGTQQSFIFLTMQLGVQLSAAAAAKATKVATPITPSKTSVGVPPLIRTTRSAKVDDRPGRYDITIIGCSPTVYQVIKEEDRSHWAQLLAARSFNCEFPRQKPTLTELLVRSKPLFWSGAPSFDWAKDGEGKVDDVNEEQEEKIEFGKGEEEEDDI